VSLNTALVTMKTANSTLNSLISTRFHPNVAPQGVTLPCIVYDVPTRVREKYFGAPVPRLSHAVVVMKCYAATSVARSALAAAALAAFATYTPATVGSLDIDGIEIDNEVDGGVEMLDTNTEAYLQILYFKAHVKEG